MNIVSCSIAPCYCDGFDTVGQSVLSRQSESRFFKLHNYLFPSPAQRAISLVSLHVVGLHYHFGISVAKMISLSPGYGCRGKNIENVTNPRLGDRGFDEFLNSIPNIMSS